MAVLAFFAINTNAASVANENSDNTKIPVFFKGELCFIEYDSLINISPLKNCKVAKTNENDITKYFELMQLDVLNNTALSADRYSKLLKPGYNTQIEKRK